MKVGFTGTQHGMTPQQKLALVSLLEQVKATELHHGDCIGADFEAHVLALGMGLRIVVHPPLNPFKRAYCPSATDCREPKEYLARNRDIVDETALLVAAPKTQDEQIRSGTWSTWRYADKKGRERKLITPEGQII